jgi:hypothetical protein
MASGLFDLDLSGGALIKIGFNGLSNCSCVGAIWHQEYTFTGISVTSLKDYSFKEIGRENFFLCQEKNTYCDAFLNYFSYAIFKPDITE